MGNGDPEVQAAAMHVTATNDADGFAQAIDQFVLA
jgi:hydroxymethylpyrimidine pyrophosphatase-like HAD family hydrolase